MALTILCLQYSRNLSFLEWTRTSFEQSLAQFYTRLLEEHLQIVLQMLDMAICSLL
jgi:hypothetical protein